MASNPKVFFDMTIGGQPTGHIIMELYVDVVPRTAKNFRALYTGEKSTGRSGDFTARNGIGGESVYDAKFADKNFVKKHIGPGVLSMANVSLVINESHFFICIAKIE
nr:peptidyl-prolyl cis-trans isomerase-like [Quercus suber]